MPELSLEFEVFCGRCGNGLCNNTRETQSRGRHMPGIQVDPCEKCLESEKEAGHDEGYDKGYNEGLKENALHAE